MLPFSSRCPYQTCKFTLTNFGNLRSASSLSGIHRGLRHGTGNKRSHQRKPYESRGTSASEYEDSPSKRYRDKQIPGHSRVRSSHERERQDHTRSSGRLDKSTYRKGFNRDERGYSAREDRGEDLLESRRGFGNEEWNERTSSNRTLYTEYSEWEATKKKTLPSWVRIPYTTAASQFLHGHSVVMAAIRARRRNLYKLYIAHTKTDADDRHAPRLDKLKRHALAAGVQVKEMDAEFLPMMDRLAGGRKHQNCLLEASPLPILPITSLGASDIKGTFDITVAPQSDEDTAINKTDSGQHSVEYTSADWRHPFLLFIDGVTDEGNLGAILRSAYLLGVDGVIIDSRRTAPLSAITLKASSGAAEALPLYSAPQPYEFLAESKQNGWKVYAADMVEGHDSTYPAVIFQDSRRGSRKSNGYSPLKEAPSILILGNEEQGVSKLLKKLTDFNVGITAVRGLGDIDLDSLNVSVASALLSMHFLKGPGALTQDPKNQLF